MNGASLALGYLMPIRDSGRDTGCVINANRASSELENHNPMNREIILQYFRLVSEPIVSKDERLDIDKMYLSIIDEETNLGYAAILNRYINWDLFEDDDCDERTIYQIEGIHYTIAHDIHNKALAEVICKVPQMMWELKRCYEEIDEVTKWKDHWERTSQTWSKVVEIFDPKANNAELNDAINKAFGHDASE